MPWFCSRHIWSKYSRSLGSVIPGVSTSGLLTIFFVLSPMFNFFFFLNGRVGGWIHCRLRPQVLPHTFMPLRLDKQDPTLCVSQMKQRARRSAAWVKAGEPWLTGSGFPDSRLGPLCSASPVPASPGTLVSGRKKLLLKPVFSGGRGKDARIFYGLTVPSRLGSTGRGESLWWIHHWLTIV